MRTGVITNGADPHVASLPTASTHALLQEQTQEPRFPGQAYRIDMVKRTLYAHTIETGVVLCQNAFPEEITRRRCACRRDDQLLPQVERGRDMCVVRPALHAQVVCRRTKSEAADDNGDGGDCWSAEGIQQAGGRAEAGCPAGLQAPLHLQREADIPCGCL